MARKTWQEKFNSRTVAEVETLNRDWAGINAGEKMLISTPAEIDAYVRAIPEGETRTMKQMSIDLAAAHGAQGSCPMTCSIFLRIATELALESADTSFPYWRIVDPKSPLAKKLPIKPELIQERRLAEVR